ncbi:MAG: hypothetical protein ABIK09_04145 [Pseudomonadota bacterium]
MIDDDLLDALADLQHDLGKYIAMPVTMLPADATDADLREAVRSALGETRRGPTGLRTAQSIWGGFLAEVGETLAGAPGWNPLVVAVAKALAWDDRLAWNAPLDRGAVTEDLRRVSERIRGLMEHLQEAT